MTDRVTVTISDTDTCEVLERVVVWLPGLGKITLASELLDLIGNRYETEEEDNG